MSNVDKVAPVSAPPSLNRQGLFAYGLVTEIGKTKTDKQRVFVSLGRDTVSVLSERPYEIGKTYLFRLNAFDAGQLFQEITEN